MAHVTGTASNLRDAVEQIRLALTTNATLAALSPAQTWQELRFINDNIESATTNMTPGTGKYPDSLCRTDPRIIATMTETDTNPEFSCTNIVNGTSYLQFKFRAAKAVTSMMWKAARSSPTMHMPRDVLLQYSDNGTSWTTAATITGQVAWVAGEERTLTGWAATGAHLWWRLVINGVGTSGTGTTIWMRSLLMYNGTELVNSSEHQTILKGPGLAGTDEIFIGLCSRKNPLTSEQYIMLHGFTGYLASERSMLKQPGVIPYGQPFIALWDQPMPFWFTLSGRRIIGVFKVSTNYIGFYAGFFLPYATAGQYPYPLAIGGSICSNGFDDTSIKYDIVKAQHSVFCMPGSISGGASHAYAITATTLAVMQPTGVWESYMNRPTLGGNSESIQYGPAHGVMPQYAWNFKPCYDNVGGGYTLWPHVLVNVQPSPRRQLGELDGTKQISGQNNSSENTGTINGHPYVIFQNVYRTARTEYWALLAE